MKVEQEKKDMMKHFVTGDSDKREEEGFALQERSMKVIDSEPVT